MVLNSQLVTFWVILLFFFGPCTAVESLLLQRLLSRELKQKCSTIGKCEMCKSNDLRTDEACKPTGRKQKFICPSTDSGANDGGKETKEVYRSCERTDADDEFSMIRFQVFCFLLGSMAFASAKKQMRLSSSLFDQRKRGLHPMSRRQTDQRGDEVELTRSEEETHQLIWNTSNQLEVI